ncbi:hypothetical protein KJK32_46970 (plasmid) [Streptomyces sp. JCM17656]|nr:hypothetical protein KJK32_46970 [Streptomyces sp. JCM17656]
MALFPRPILTNGATHSAQQFRMLVRDLANGAEGITQGDDLKVTQRSTPGGGVLVGDGSAVVRGVPTRSRAPTPPATSAPSMCRSLPPVGRRAPTW